MRRVIIHGPGSYDRLQFVDEPPPMPGAGEVRVRAEAIGVNYADCLVRMGLYASAKEYVGWPITPGFEVAGRIDALGAGVDGLALGQPVIAVTRFGGYAEQLIVPRWQVFAKPEKLSMPQAAGFSTVLLTAYYALFELVHPYPGDWLLVHSAAGGVGSALVQLARLAETNVVGVVGAAHKVPHVQRLGAKAVIDKSAVDLWAEARRLSPLGYHAVFDANGPTTLRGSYRHLATPGKLVVYGFHAMLPRRGGRPSRLKLFWDYLRTPRFNPLWMVTENRGILAFNLSYLFGRVELLQKAMASLFGWLESGQLQPPIVKSYPFAQVGQAHRELESGQTVGKLVLLADGSTD